jgi:hypothetical protein
MANSVGRAVRKPGPETTAFVTLDSGQRSLRVEGVPDFSGRLEQVKTGLPLPPFALVVRPTNLPGASFDNQ